MRPRPIVEVARSAEPALLLGLAAFLMLLLSKSDVVQFDEGYTLNAAWQTWNGHTGTGTMLMVRSWDARRWVMPY